MAFGINNFTENFSLQRIFLQIKRLKQVHSLRKFNTIVSIGCTINKIKVGNNIFLGERVSIFNCEIDDFSYINNDSKIRNTSIGKFCSIGPNVKIILGKHPSTFVSTHPVFYANNKPFKTFSDAVYVEEYGHVKIGHDVWIGEGAIIPNTVTIGNGAIITARSVVTKDVEPYSIVGGIPAKHIKFRFDKEMINIINDSKWWDWNPNELKNIFKILHDPIEFKNYLSHKKKNDNV